MRATDSTSVRCRVAAPAARRIVAASGVLTGPVFAVLPILPTPTMAKIRGPVSPPGRQVTSSALPLAPSCTALFVRSVNGAASYGLPGGSRSSTPSSPGQAKRMTAAPASSSGDAGESESAGAGMSPMVGPRVWDRVDFHVCSPYPAFKVEAHVRGDPFGASPHYGLAAGRSARAR